MTTRLSDIFSSVSSSEFPYLVSDEFIITKTAEKTKVIITPDNVDETEIYLFNQFLSALSIDPNLVNNYGISTYNNETGEHSGFCPAYFGIDSSGRMGLRIGVTQKPNYSSIFIPCESEEAEVPHGKKTKKVWVYTLNGAPIDLEQLLDQTGKPIANYLVLEHFDDVSNTTEKYSFPILVDKSTANTLEEVSIRFSNGSFQLALRNLDSSSIYLASNKAFLECFRQNTFPKTGVMMLVKNGHIKVTKAGSHPNIKNDIQQSEWEIIATSHPELLVSYKTDGRMETTRLCEANKINFTSAMRNNEGYGYLTSKGYNIGEIHSNVALIHIIRSADNIGHTPVNTCTSIPTLIKSKLMKFPHLADAYNKQIGGGEPYQEVKASDLVRSVQTVDVAAAKQEFGRDSFKTVQQVEQDDELDAFLEDDGVELPY